MRDRGNSWAIAALIVLMTLASAWVWLQLPPGSRVAVHFDA